MRVGPKHFRPAARKRSTTPATSGPSGPTTVRSTCFASRERDQAVDVGRRDIGVAKAGLARGAGVAGRDDDLVDARRLLQVPGERVLAAAGADDQYFHRGFVTCGKMSLSFRRRPESGFAELGPGLRRDDENILSCFSAGSGARP